ncbi:hypothetical protein P5V15_014016 [Pogonomyrmex californicus]
MIRNQNRRASKLVVRMKSEKVRTRFASLVLPDAGRTSERSHAFFFPSSNDLHEKYSTSPSFVCTNDQHAMYSVKGSSAPYDASQVRLLSRRYTLTATGYKFLEIGINIGPPSYVEITLADHRGQELTLFSVN